MNIHGGAIQFSRDGEPAQSVTFSGGDLTADCIQASISAAIGQDSVYVIGSADYTALSAMLPKVTPRAYIATKDRRGWLTASWQCISGGEPSRLRRFHALGCRWNPATRQWSCADNCNVPQWEEEEAAADNDW
jgi:hypothetical protein